MKLTDENILDSVCPPGRKDVMFFDDTLPGFGLRVTAKGKRIFIAQYNVGKTKRRTVLGEYGADLTVAEARKRATKLRGQMLEKRDPVAERKATLAATLAAEAEARAKAARDAYTVDKLITDWTNHHLATRSESYRLRVPRDMRAALKKWLAVPADTLTRTDSVRVLDTVKSGSGPVAANRLRAVSRACWSWAVKRGALAANPWEATPRPQARETGRERVLSDDELAVLYSAAGALDEPWGVLIRLLILTGQRRGEVAGMQWSELDLKEARWTIPGDRAKNHHTQIVPLADEAVALLRTIKKRKDGKFVFEGPRKTAVSGFGKVKARLDVALQKAAGADQQKPAPWVLHDLRRTLATGLQRLGVRLEVTEAVLNHVSGSRKGIVGVYQRHGWEKEKEAALTAWTNHVLAALKPIDASTSNVVQMKGRKGRKAA